MSGHNLNYQLAENYNKVQEDPGDAGTLETQYSDVIHELVTAGAETRSLATPGKAGLRQSIYLKTDGGDVVITGSGSEVFWDGTTAHTQITLNTVRDFITVVSTYSGSTIGWTVVENAGAALA